LVLLKENCQGSSLLLVIALHEEMMELSIARSYGLSSYVRVSVVNMVKKMCDAYGNFLSIFQYAT